MELSDSKIESPDPSTSVNTPDVDTLLRTAVPDDDDGGLLGSNLTHHHHELDTATAANFRSLPSQINDQYHRITISDRKPTQTDEAVTKQIREAISLREKWIFKRQIPEWSNYPPPRHTDYTVFIPPPYDPFDMEYPSPSRHVCHWQDGVVSVFEDRRSVIRRKPLFQSLSFNQFTQDLYRLSQIIEDPECRSFCYRRLMLLQERFNMYLILNENQERLAQVAAPHRDIYNVRKVDVHVHHSSMANQKHLLRFIKRKVKEHGDEKVLENRTDPSKEALTLDEVFKSLDLTPHELSVDTLNVHADKSTFHRFDRFNLKYNPFGQSRLREIFMKTDNYIEGRYLAEMTHEVFKELEETKYQHSEPRISIYGRDPMEWNKLGLWFRKHKVYSDNVRWLIQIPRLYSTYKKSGSLESFQDMLDNIFNPLFEATTDPSAHPEVSLLLQQIVGFDSVDDESKMQIRTDLRRCGSPDQWVSDENPPYSYYSFYIYSNLCVLNQLRESKGMNTFTYRPHAGEAGDIEHLVTTFLLAHGVNHGLTLKRNPVLQYLYYLTQIGIAMSPLSNNALFCAYTKNPLPTYFKRGLNVTLSSDDPLQFAFTREPLMEEYSVAAQVWKLSNTDICELARNSVLQSGFEPCVKAHWLGENWFRPGEDGNDISRTNVPSLRLRYRYDTLLEELQLIYNGNIPKDVTVLPTYTKRNYVSNEGFPLDEPQFKTPNGTSHKTT